MNLISSSTARRSCRALGTTDTFQRRNVKAAFESDKAPEARKPKEASTPGSEHPCEENELLPVHHPGSFPLHGKYHTILH